VRHIHLSASGTFCQCFVADLALFCFSRKSPTGCFQHG
jgi:hypothetical protein